MRIKILCWFATIFYISLLSLALGGCGGGGDDGGGNPPPSNDKPTTGTISGTVSGTEIIAVNDAGVIVASDDTAGKTADSTSGNFSFTLTGVPIDTDIRVYLITASGAFPLYFGSPSTNVFSLSAETTLDLGFVDTTTVQGKATPENDPAADPIVSVGPPNSDTVVRVTDENSGALLAGATVIVDHASDPRQFDTTTATGIVSFTPLSSGPVTVTIGKSGYEFFTVVDFNLVYLDITLKLMGLSAFVEGTASVTNGNVSSFGSGDLRDECPTCENLGDGTIGFYRLATGIPNNVFNLSAFDYGNNGPGGGPINFTEITGVGPLTDGQTLTWDPVFPVTPPATASTLGTITSPASLGSLIYMGAIGARDIFAPDGQVVGLSAADVTSPYNYTLTTFDYTAAGNSDDIMALAAGTAGGMSFSVIRGVGFGGSGRDFNLIDIPTNLSPTGSCGGITPSISWTGVAGASFYGVNLKDSDSAWMVLINAGTTSFTLPDLTGTVLAGLGLTTGDSVELGVEAMVVPGFDFNAIDQESIMSTFTDRSESPTVTCDSTASTSNLKFTFIDNIASNTPVSGVTVALYNSDNRTINTTLVSGADGVVDFGQISGTATVTIAYVDPFNQEHYIDTHVDFQPINVVYNINDDLLVRPGEKFPRGLGTCFSIGDISVSGFASGTIYSVLQSPTGSAQVDVTGNATFLGNFSCDVFLQDDSNISLLSIGLDGTTVGQSNATSYGYTLDKLPSSVVTYSIIADTPFTTYTYSSPAGSTVSEIDVNGIRKGVFYGLIGGFSGGILSSTGAGEIPIASSFPVDMYSYFAVDTLGDGVYDNYKAIIKQSVNLPTSIVPEFSDVVLTTSSYNNTTKTFSWTKSGTGPSDFVNLYMTSYLFSSGGTFGVSTWEVTLPLTSSSYTLPDLPAPANSWVDVPNLDLTDMCASVEVFDFDIAASYEEIINLLASVDLKTVPYLLTVASRNVDNTCLPPAVP